MNKLKDSLVGLTLEEKRLEENKAQKKYWYRWGPYLSERQWATVREDYSNDGDAWAHFPFEHANARVFRWGEDGLFGVSDNRQLVCMNVALWNGKDCRLKERLFGLTGHQGNHGEDVKELYYYLDNTPTHSYMKALYKYPFKKPFPYDQLIEENGKRGYQDLEFEVQDIDGLYKEKDTGDTPYYDVFFEMAKGDDNPNDLNYRITVHNRSEKDSGELYVVPQIFFRNTWAWDEKLKKNMPTLSKDPRAENLINIKHDKYGKQKIAFQPSPGVEEGSDDVDPKLLFTDNEPNLEKLFDNQKNPSPYSKDAFEEYIVHKNTKLCNPAETGSKAGAVYHFPNIPPGKSVTIRYKFTDDVDNSFFHTKDLVVIDEDSFDTVLGNRKEEADNFYWRVNPEPISPELRNIQRQAFAGLLWTKQFYNFTYDAWYSGDPNIKPRPMQGRANNRNGDWKHLYIEDVLSMPDKWEYPFFASWDTAFHCIPLAMIDPEFAKKQLHLLTREWYMHPNGQIPAYEWNFNDVNPPVHAWAVYRVYTIEKQLYGRSDSKFLERVFQKLLLNFTWWVNRKDAAGKNLFEGGFLGLDNIGIFNRSEPLPTGGTLEQADSTAWMAFFSLQMLNIALELAKGNSAYEDIASKFFEHFILIADTISFNYDNSAFDDGVPRESLWNEQDKFYYDAISWGTHRQQLPIRSLVGLIPLYASMTLESDILKQFPDFKKRVDWFVENRKDIFGRNVASMSKVGHGSRSLLSLVTKERLEAILTRMLDPNEFLSEYGIRSLSKYHESHPYEMDVHGQKYRVQYLPGESDSGMFGGNSNWRGPIWFSTSYLIIESLQRFHMYYGPDFKVECPVGSGNYMNLAEVSEEIAFRMIRLFIKDPKNGQLPIYEGANGDFLSNDKHFKDLVTFYEYFHGDTGRGLGATHQCGWTALVAKWIGSVGLYETNTPDTKTLLENIPSKGLADGEPKLKGASSRPRSKKSLFNVKAASLEIKEKQKDNINTTYVGATDEHKYETELIEELKKKMSTLSFSVGISAHENNADDLACHI